MLVEPARLTVTGALVLALAGCAQHILPVVALEPEVAHDSVETSLFLIGDAGEPAGDGEPVLKALVRQLERDSGRSVVVFLGDNAYPLGIPDSLDPTFAEARRRLVTLVAAVRDARARGFLIPGNHDWRRGREGGLAAVRRADAIVEVEGDGAVVQVPDGGCPGPAVVDVASRLRLVFVDTQWWLQATERPEGAALGCAENAHAAFDSLRAVLGSSGERHVVVAGHHPMESGGEHGGFFEWKDHIFPLRGVKSWLWLPLPILGSAYPVSRMLGVTDQDFAGSRYGALRDSMAAVFRVRQPLVYASGHDHSLQVIEAGPARYQLVSGVGFYGHLDPVRPTEGTRMAISKSGFMRLDVAIDGRVRLGVHTVDASGGSSEVYSQWLTP